MSNQISTKAALQSLFTAMANCTDQTTGASKIQISPKRSDGLSLDGWDKTRPSTDRFQLQFRGKPGCGLSSNGARQLIEDITELPEAFVQRMADEMGVTLADADKIITVDPITVADYHRSQEISDGLSNRKREAEKGVGKPVAHDEWVFFVTFGNKEVVPSEAQRNVPRLDPSLLDLF